MKDVVRWKRKNPWCKDPTGDYSQWHVLRTVDQTMCGTWIPADREYSNTQSATCKVCLGAIRRAS